MKTYLLVVLLFSIFDVFAQPLKSDSQYYSGVNYLTNGGFEQGRKGWTNSAGTFAITAANGAIDGLAGCVTLSSQTLNLENITTNNAANLVGDGHLDVEVYSTVAGVQACTVVNGVEQNCVPIVNLSSWANKVGLNFVFGGTSYGVRLKTAGAVSGTVCADIASVRKTEINEVAQAQSLGSIRFGTDCTSSVTSGSFTDMVDATCTETISGSILAASSNRIGASIPAGSPPGKYVFHFVFPAGIDQTAVNQTGYFALTYDGTRFSETLYRQLAANDSYDGLTLIGEITETTSLAAAKDVYLQARIGTAQGVGYNTFGDSQGYLIVTYYPPASKIYSQQCDDPRQCENVFSANIDSAGTVSGENLDFINGNASSGGTGIRTITWNTGIFTADPNCVLTVIGGSSASNELHIEISSSSSTSLTYETASTGADANLGAKIVCQKQGADYKAQNQITGTFTNVVTVPGISKPKICTVKFGGAGSISSVSTCSSSPCTEYQDTCNLTSSISRGATGTYSFAVLNGTWAPSSPLSCFQCRASDGSGSNVRDCHIYSNVFVTNASGGVSSIDFFTTSTTGGVVDTSVDVTCYSQAP